MNVFRKMGRIRFQGLISKIMLYWPLLSTRKRNNFYHSPNRFARLEFRILARVRYEKRAGLEGLLIIHRRLLTKRVFLPKRQCANEHIRQHEKSLLFFNQLEIERYRSNVAENGIGLMRTEHYYQQI